MPIYEYRCKNGHVFDVMQGMMDDPVSVCEVCGADVERVFHPVAVHFKGSGFYSTDYGKKQRAGAAAASGDSASSDSTSGDSGGSKTDSGSSKSESETSAKKSDSKSGSDS